MDRLWGAIDLGDNLGKCLRVARGMHGLQAGIMACVTGLIAITTFALAWTFDIQSTIDATSILVTQIDGNLPYAAARYTALVILGITFMPTLIELGGAAFAREGSTPFQWLVVALSVFDLLTDAPLTTDFVGRYDWATFGVFEWPAYAIAWVMWLGLSSFFFEMVAACMAVTTFALVLRAFMKTGATGRQQVM